MLKNLINPNPKLDWKSGQIAYFEKPDKPNELDWGEINSIKTPSTLNPTDVRLYKIRIVYQHLLHDFTPDQLFESYEQAEQAIKARTQANANEYAAGIQTAADLIRFMYSHGFSISRGACKNKAIRSAIKARAESICGIKLQDF